MAAPTLSVQAQTSGQPQLNIVFPVATKATIEVSTDLETWLNYSEITTPSTEWSTAVNLEGHAKFYRAVEVP